MSTPAQLPTYAIPAPFQMLSPDSGIAIAPCSKPGPNSADFATATCVKFEITRFEKFDGPLTKQIELAPDGMLKSDGSACVMSYGIARRVQLSGMQPLADLIGQLGPNEAIALGSLRHDLSETVQIITKRALTELNGDAQRGVIARTANNIHYRPGQAAFALLDYDTKGMPPGVAECISQHGGYWPALVAVLPELAVAARVQRLSTSAGLYRTDTGNRLPGSNGVHIYIAIRDGCDADRFLKTLHNRCWLAGLGWMMVGAGGALLERSIVDRMVGAPERLVFEGPPVIVPPLAQELESRRPTVMDGTVLDTLAACPPLTIVEQAKLRQLLAMEAKRLAPESQKAREAFIVYPDSPGIRKAPLPNGPRGILPA